MDLSIVIINWNGIDILRNCLSSIFSRPRSIAFEVIMVDNASSDSSVATVEREFPQVKIIRNSENRGFAAANNQAFAVALGRHILLLNNDTVILGNALEDAVQFLDAHPEVGALGCRVQFPDGSFQTSCYRFNDLFALLMTRFLPIGSMRRERFNYGRYWARQFTEPTDVDVVAGCFMAVPRSVIQKVHGLDEDFFMYGEDEEWCSRIKLAGWRVVYLPNSKIIHLHRFSSRRARRALRLIECMAPILVLEKRRGSTIAWMGNLILLSAAAWRLPFCLFLDLVHVIRGTAQQGLVRSRFVVLAAHLRGVFSPVWLPYRGQPTNPLDGIPPLATL